MKRYAILMVALAISANVGRAQDGPWANKFFDGLTHNFGSVAWGQQLSHKFTITNIYNVPFVVEDARVSCGCVTPLRPTGAIAPRETAQLEALMDTRKIPPTGAVKTVQIYVKLTSVPQKAGEKVYTSMATLSVSSLPQSNLRFSADKIVLGSVPAGQAVTGSVEVEHFTDGTWQITEVNTENQPVDVKTERVQPRQGGRVCYRIAATLKNTAPAGDFKYEIKLTTTDRNTRVLTLVVEGTVKAALEAAPNHLSLGNVKVGEVVTGRTVIKGPGQPFKIVKVEGDGDGLTVRVNDKAAPVHLVTVEFIPKQPGKLSKTLKIKTDLPGDLTATVTVEGNGTP